MSPTPEPVTPRSRRETVTQEALSVAPAMLGLPLARPWRRGAAIAVDGLLVSILANAPSVLLGFAAAYVLFRVSARSRPGAGYIRRSFRMMFRVGGAFMLFAAVVSLWNTIGERIGSNEDEAEGRVAASIQTDGGDISSRLSLSGMEAVQFGVERHHLRADNEEDTRQVTTALLQRLRAGGLSGAEARTMVRDLTGDADAEPWRKQVVEEVLAADAAAEPSEAIISADSVVELTPDSLIVAYAAAISDGDSARVDSLRPSVVALLSQDTVGVLADAISSLGSERARLETRVDELEEELEDGIGIMSILRAVVDDLGLGLGWFGLYFTATTAMWHGRTPGKRLFGIRVISLTGKPIGWWASFERFGGYAAGFATGLLGFAQVLWDDNRQAIHDKIAVTVVIRDRS